MPQFPMTDSRRPILERIPDYEVAISQAAARVRVSIGDRMIADSTRPLLVRETRHGDVYYLPAEDVRLSLLTRTDHATYCPFKGHASYYSFGASENVVWSYEDPYPEVSALKGYLSFYPSQVSQSVTEVT